MASACRSLPSLVGLAHCRFYVALSFPLLLPLMAVDGRRWPLMQVGQDAALALRAMLWAPLTLTLTLTLTLALALDWPRLHLIALDGSPFEQDVRGAVCAPSAADEPPRYELSEDAERIRAAYGALHRRRRSEDDAAAHEAGLQAGGEAGREAEAGEADTEAAGGDATQAAEEAEAAADVAGAPTAADAADAAHAAPTPPPPPPPLASSADGAMAAEAAADEAAARDLLMTAVIKREAAPDSAPFGWYLPSLEPRRYHLPASPHISSHLPASHRISPHLPPPMTCHDLP